MLKLKKVTKRPGYINAHNIQIAFRDNKIAAINWLFATN